MSLWRLVRDCLSNEPVQTLCIDSLLVQVMNSVLQGFYQMNNN